MKRFLLIGILFTLCPGPAGAIIPDSEPLHPDLSGVWVLDLDASDSLDDMLKRQGISGVRRRIMRKTVVTQSIEHRGNTLTIHVDSKHKHATEHLILDGESRPAKTPEGQDIMQKALWSENGLEVISRADVVLDDGSSAVLEIRRRLGPEGSTLLMEIYLRPEDGDILYARRVFRKKT